ncbi:hypothetical protein HK102_000089 [Quaeritorhiza haematococci]|nr:hypothetical protein HK102_000089 [Quaeritorhiza haematococci]
MINGREADEKAFKLHTQLASMTAHLKSVQKLTAVQGSTIKTLTATVSALETRLKDSTERLESSFKYNKTLAGKYQIAEGALQDKTRKLEAMESGLAKWKRWKRDFVDVVYQDWKSCINELGLSDLFENLDIAAIVSGSSTEAPSPFDNPVLGISGLRSLLTDNIKKARKESNELRRALSSRDKEISQLEREHSSLLQRYMRETEKRKVELDAAKERLKEMTSMAEKARRERDEALQRSQDAVKECAGAKERFKAEMSRKDEELAELAQKNAEQQKQTREQYERERVHMQQLLERMQVEKADLQVEVGRLMREKRSAEFELDSVHKVGKKDPNMFLKSSS